MSDLARLLNTTSENISIAMSTKNFIFSISTILVSFSFKIFGNRQSRSKLKSVRNSRQLVCRSIGRLINVPLLRSFSAIWRCCGRCGHNNGADAELDLVYAVLVLRRVLRLLVRVHRLGHQSGGAGAVELELEGLHADRSRCIHSG